MRFLVASDSHGRVSSLLEMVRRAHTKRFPADGIIFLGDGLSDLAYLRDEGLPLFFVRGNCDGLMIDAPTEEILTFEGHRIFYTHGHHYSVKSGTDSLVSVAAERGADIVLYGHTHVPKECYYAPGDTVGATVLNKPLYLMNPGSIREGYGDDTAGFGVLEITESTVLWSRVAFI